MVCCIKLCLELAFILKWFVSLNLHSSFFDLVQDNKEDIVFFFQNRCHKALKAAASMLSNFLCYIPG